jgi:uncharacterized membrane protein YbhN (UPF0104 family)
VRHRWPDLAFAALLLVLLGIAATVVVGIGSGTNLNDQANRSSIVSAYLALVAMCGSALWAGGRQWLREREKRRNHAPVPPKPWRLPRRVAAALHIRVRWPKGAWLGRVRRQAVQPYVVILATGAGLVVDATITLFHRTPAQAALTAIVTTVLAYVVAVLVATEGPGSS